MGPHAELAPVTTVLPAGAAREGAPAPATGLVRSAAVSLAGAGAAGLLNAVLSVATTRGFSKVEAGELFATTSVFVLLYTITRLGAGTGVVYFLARHRALDELERIRPTLRASLVPVLGMSVLVAGVLLIWAPQVAQLSGRPHSGAVDVALRALAIFLPLAALSDLWIATARGFGSLGPLVVIEKVLRPALQVVATLAVAVLGLRPALWLPLAWAAPYALSAAVALVWLRTLVGRSDLTLRRSAGSAYRTRGRPSEMRPFWRFTAPRSVTSIVQVALQRLDVLLVFSILGPAEAAIYTAATRFLILGQLGSQALSVATQHRFARLLAVGDTAGAKQLYALVTGWLVLLTWPAYLAFAVFGDYVLEIFGRGYKVGWSVMIVLALMMLIATGCGMVENVLNMAGKTVWNLVNNGVALAANVGLNLLLIPRWGLVGAATAWAVSIFLSNAVPLVQLAWKLKLHPFGPSVYVSAALSVATFGVAAPLLRLVAGPVVALVVPTLLLLVGIRLLRRTLAVDAMVGQLLSGRGRRAQKA